MAGRPTLYSEEIIAKAREYLEGGWKEAGDMIPSIAGLSCEIGIHRETLRLWSKDEGNAFFGILRELDAAQERELLAGGLSNRFSGTISKLVLTRHGYSDKIDNTSSDGTMSPKGLDLSKLPKEALEAIVEAADEQFNED